jgi:hypothetical protein
MSASDISMKPRHLAHLKTHKRKAVSELMVCSARARWLGHLVLVPLLTTNVRNIYLSNRFYSDSR